MTGRFARLLSFVVLAALAAALAGCAQTLVQPADRQDESLTSEQYVQRGLPSPERRWDADDYQQASKVLGALAKESLRRLPKHGSAKSGAVFARLVAPENLEAFRSAGGSIDQRFGNAALLGLKLTPAYAEVVKMYGEAIDAGTAGNREFIELTGFALRTLGVQTSLVTEADVRQLTEQGRTEMPERYRRVQAEVSTSVIGALRLLEDSRFEDAERIRIAEILHDTLPALVGTMPRAGRTEAMLRMEALAGQFADPRLKGLLQQLREEFGRAATS